MIKNEHSASNDEIGKVLEDIRNNHGFGSLFQFWVWQTLKVLQEEFYINNEDDVTDMEVTLDKLHNLAIKIINTIGQ